MAIFNPQVQPGNDDMPNYFKYSEAIKQPESDKSTGLALQTIGAGLDGAVELADSTVKSVIKNDVYDRVDAERNSFTGFLDATKNPNDPNNGNPSAVGTNGPNPAPLNIMADNTQSVPTAIDNGVSKVGTLQAGLAGNKITETTYYQRLNSITKDLRATYPGYRDYIDSEVSKITGVTPANAYISSIIQDINAQNSKQNADKEFWQKQIVSNSGFPGSAQMLQQYQQTGDSNKVMQWLSFNQGAIDSLKFKKAAMESQDEDTKSRVDAAKSYADSVVSHAATISFSNSSRFGISAADISDRMIDLTAHPEKANDPVYQNLGAQYEALRVQATTEATKALTTRGVGPDGKLQPSVADIIGPEAVKKKVADSVGALFSQTSDFIKDKQFSPAYTLQQAAEGTISNATFKVLSDPSLQGRIATAGALNRVAPNLSPIIVGKLLGQGLDKDLNTLVTQQGAQAIAQPQGSGKYYGRDGQIYSFKQSLDELDQAGRIRGTPVPGQAFNNLLEVRKAITDSTANDATKANAIKYFYDPVNKGVMNKFMDDYYDPTKDGMVKGRSSAFATLTGGDVTKSIWDYAQGHPSAWQDYSSWAKGEFSTQLRNQIADIDKLDKDSNNYINGIPGSQFKVNWNSDTHQFILKNHDGSDLDGIQSTSLNSAYRTVNNLNMGLKNIANIAKQEGSNVDAYVFKVLKDAGYSPNKDMEGVPAQVMRGMITANGGKVSGTVPVPAPVSRFADEGPQGDLQSFLTNPAGSNGLLEASDGGPQATRGIIKGNLSDSQIVNMRTDDIPENMSAREFINQLRSGKKMGGSVQ